MHSKNARKSQSARLSKDPSPASMYQGETLNSPSSPRALGCRSIDSLYDSSASFANVSMPVRVLRSHFRPLSMAVAAFYVLPSLLGDTHSPRDEFTMRKSYERTRARTSRSGRRSERKASILPPNEGAHRGYSYLWTRRPSRRARERACCMVSRTLPPKRSSSQGSPRTW